ncbi:MAG: hypothetical protein RSC43_00155 [Clostridia bacterium]
MPDPFWEEVALYGGYRWIQFMENKNIWVSRKWESQLAMFMDAVESAKPTKCDLSCMIEFKDMLSDYGILQGHIPSYREAQQKAATGIFIPERKYAQDILFVKDVESQNEMKILRELKKQDIIYVAGFSPLIAKFITDGRINAITSSHMTYDCRLVCMSDEDIMQKTINHKVFVPSNRLTLKGGVRNWANVITI